jgi:hypothetical protein
MQGQPEAGEPLFPPWAPLAVFQFSRCGLHRSTLGLNLKSVAAAAGGCFELAGADLTARDEDGSLRATARLLDHLETSTALEHDIACKSRRTSEVNAHGLGRGIRHWDDRDQLERPDKKVHPPGALLAELEICPRRQRQALAASSGGSPSL